MFHVINMDLTIHSQSYPPLKPSNSCVVINPTFPLQSPIPKPLVFEPHAENLHLVHVLTGLFTCTSLFRDILVQLVGTRERNQIASIIYTPGSCIVLEALHLKKYQVERKLLVFKRFYTQWRVVLPRKICVSGS